MTDCQLPRLKVASCHQLLAILLITGFALFFVHTATAQPKPSDSEMKEVVRMLLEREVQRSADGGNVVVLLGPNVKSSWIPEVSGFDIRQLSYDEQKLVPEYYELSSSFKGSVIEIGLTKVLPSASWSLDTSILLSFREGNSCNLHLGVEIGWEEIKRRTTPLWLRVSYEMWPFNVENFKPNLGGILQKRWRSHGLLYLDEKVGRYWQAILTSEPIEISFNQIDLAR